MSNAWLTLAAMPPAGAAAALAMRRHRRHVQHHRAQIAIRPLLDAAEEFSRSWEAFMSATAVAAADFTRAARAFHDALADAASRARAGQVLDTRHHARDSG